MNHVGAPPGDWGQRTPADLSGLLVELSRALKGQGFYEPDHPALRAILDRAFLAWQVEIERAGPIELSVEDDGLRCVGVAEPQPLEATLGDQLRMHAVEALQATRELTHADFARFVAVLARDPDDLAEGLIEELAPVPATATGGIEVRCAEAKTHARVPPADPPPVGDATASLAETKPPLEDAPLDAAAGDADGEHLRQNLLRLAGCTSDSAYERTALQVVSLANLLAEGGAEDEGYRAMLVLADDAGGQAGRSAPQQQCARTALEQLASGPRLLELIDRAASNSGGGAIRAAQILLQLGQRTLGPILQVLETEAEPERVAQLSAIVVALGDRVVAALRSAIENAPIANARIAVRLAGELQSPELLATLIQVFEGDRSELTREAAKALVVAGNDEAVAALCRALPSRDDSRAELAAHCLGAARHLGAVDPLLETLDRATRSHRLELARACVRSLGQLGSDHATPKLVAIVERRHFFQRKRQRGLKLAALSALAQLPCREARRAIGRARSSRDTALRQHARQLQP